LVNPTVADELISQRADQSRVGAGTDRNPLIGMRGGRVGVARVNDDGTRTLAIHGRINLITFTAARRSSRREIVAKEHVQRSIGDFRRQRGGTAAVGEREGFLQLRIGIRAVVLQIAAVQIHKTLPSAAGAHDGLLTGAILPIDGFGTVLVEDALPLLGDDVGSFVPRDALKFAFATFADAFHRVLQAIGRIDALAHGATALASPNLTRTGRIVR